MHPRASPPPADGDWVVNDATYIADQTIIVNGSLMIQAGGNLSLSNVTIIFNCTRAGQFRLEVRAGGVLQLRKCNITSASKKAPYLFWANATSRLDVADSEIHRAGYAYSATGNTSGLLLRTTDAVFRNVVFSENFEAIHAQDCSPRFINCTFELNEVGCAAYNSTPGFSNCLFLTNNDSGLSLYDRSNITVTGCNFTNNSYYALYINRSKVNVTANIFDFNYISVQAEYSEGVTIWNNSFWNEKYRGVGFWYCPSGTVHDDVINTSYRMAFYAKGSVIAVRNVTLAAGSYPVYLDGGSQVEMLNCTVTMLEPYFHDYESRVNLSFYLNTRVRWWSNESGVPGASITALNGTNNVTFTGTTDGTGLLAWKAVQIYRLGKNLNQRFGPFTVNVNKNGLVGSGATDLNKTIELEILLDDLGPVVNIVNPSNGTSVNHSYVEFNGTAWDNETGVTSIDYKVDNGTWQPAAGTSQWNFSANLSEGKHVVYVRSRDTANNTRTVNVTVSVDTNPPALCVTTPENGLVTHEQLIQLMGTAEANSTVSVNGAVRPLDNGTFGAVLNLTEGDNLVTVLAQDRAGNLAEITLKLRLDTMITPFELYPANATWSKQSNISIYGKIEANTNLTFRALDAIGNATGVQVDYNSKDGNFSVPWELANGTNRIQVVASDPYGNVEPRELYLFLDLIPPMLRLDSPSANESWTRERRLVISGAVEKDANLYLNGKLILVENGCFSKSITLDLNENDFNLTALDNAGNYKTMLFRVNLDRYPPFLNITSPKNGARTTNSKISIKGFVEENALVYINGKKAKVVNYTAGTSRFSLDVDLKMGNNTFTIQAFDRAGNPAALSRLVVRNPPPPLLSDIQLVAVGLACVFIAFVAVIVWDTKRTTGKWGLKRPRWMKVPDRVRAYLPKPTYGREEGETGTAAVVAEPGKDGQEPQAPGAAPPPPLPRAPAFGPAPQRQPAAPAAPAAPAPQPAPTAKLGDEFGVSEKTGAPSPLNLPGASESPTELPTAEPPGGAEPPKPAAPAAPPEPPAEPEKPPEPPKPVEVDPLAEIMGGPTKKT